MHIKLHKTQYRQSVHIILCFLYAKCRYYAVLYMQSVLIIKCFICKAGQGVPRAAAPQSASSTGLRPASATSRAAQLATGSSGTIQRLSNCLHLQMYTRRAQQRSCSRTNRGRATGSVHEKDGGEREGPVGTRWGRRPHRGLRDHVLPPQHRPAAFYITRG